MVKLLNSHNPYKIEYWINKGYSEKIGKLKIDEQKNKTSNRRIEFWLNKGFTEEEAKEKIKYLQSKSSKKVKNRVSNTQLSYWINKGFTEEEAKEKIKERQSVGSLKNFIKRYGEEEGKLRWQARQIKWQQTLNNRFSKDERKKWSSFTYEDMIEKYGKERADSWLKSKYKAKGISYSKISQSLFDSIAKTLNRNFYYGKNEYVIKRDKWTYVVDFYDKKTNKVIEFFGTIFHADPRFYKEGDISNPWRIEIAKDIWERDELRINNIKTTVNDILIIWEDDYYNSKEKELIKCINFLKNG